jgi:hypothetical protein
LVEGKAADLHKTLDPRYALRWTDETKGYFSVGEEALVDRAICERNPRPSASALADFVKVHLEAL